MPCSRPPRRPLLQPRRAAVPLKGLHLATASERSRKESETTLSESLWYTQSDVFQRRHEIQDTSHLPAVSQQNLFPKVTFLLQFDHCTKHHFFFSILLASAQVDIWTTP